MRGGAFLQTLGLSEAWGSCVVGHFYKHWASPRPGVHAWWGIFTNVGLLRGLGASVVGNFYKRWTASLQIRSRML